MVVRYCIETIFQDTVSDVLKKNNASQDASVWDYVSQTDITTYEFTVTAKAAEKIARKNVSQDEFGEIRIIKQIETRDYVGNTLWEDDQISYLYPETETLKWNSVE